MNSPLPGWWRVGQQRLLRCLGPGAALHHGVPAVLLPRGQDGALLGVPLLQLLPAINRTADD